MIVVSGEGEELVAVLPCTQRMAGGKSFDFEWDL